VLLVLTAAGAWADEAAPPTDPPQARLEPPVGVTTQARMQPPVGIAPPDDGTTTKARVSPPVGVTPQVRLNPPSGAPTPDHLSLLDMIMIWFQSRISVPNW
jgi:hypothetical protein